MILIPAPLLFLLAQYRRKQGLYNHKTLDFFEKSCELSPTPKKLVTYAKFQRDINGTVTPDTRKKLEEISTRSNRVNTQAHRLLLENNLGSELNSPKDSTDSYWNTISTKQQQWRAELLSWLANKSIAIVGNGVSLKHSNLGNSIDSRAVVCRFNNIPNGTKFYSDIGKKTDIWIISPDIATTMPTPHPDIKWIIVTGGDVRFTLQNWEWSEQHLILGRRIVTIPIKVWSSLVQKLEAPPSAGVLWINYLLSQPNLAADIHLYGFDRCAHHSSRYHMASTHFRPSGRHAWGKEKLYLERLGRKSNITPHYGKRFGVFSNGILSNDYLKRHLSSPEFTLRPSAETAKELDGIIGWGRKANTHAALRYAQQHKLNYFTLEDGFIHSMSQGRLGAHSWSLVKDSTGIFYDATTASDLENLINQRALKTEETARARNCLELLTKNHITKYNNGKLGLPDYLNNINQAILVIDQVEGDTSIPYALAEPTTFDDMMIAALSENPSTDILLKIHPDVINGRRKGCIDPDVYKHPRVTVVSENINPIVLMQLVKKVYVVSSQTGFEALLLGKMVICFGVPFYANWGLTDDRKTSPTRQRRVARPNVLTLFHCVYIDYSSYIHPETDNPCEIEDILDYVALQNNYYRANAGQWLCLGLAPWKRRFIRHYLKSHDNKIHFIRNASRADQLNCDSNTKVLIWSSRFEAEAKTIQEKYHSRLYKAEDGFIRSVGLGVNYTLPSSLVIDEHGIYFDPNQASDLENLLANHQFSSAAIERAQTLINLIITRKISKYNAISSLNKQTPNNSEQQTILIPGQVADDASIKLGCPGISDNFSLIKQVRKKYKHARILYKPHPDVVNGRRQGTIAKGLVLQYCDEIISDISISDCLSQADEVHTLTSLVGFEALLRGITVHCYGLPFYAGWGLTNDHHEHERRSRQLSIEELVAGALLVYPRYYDWENEGFTTPESVINDLSPLANNENSANKLITKYLPKRLSLLIHLCNAMIKAR